MAELIKTVLWTEVEQKLKQSQNNNLLLGNGFSIEWDSIFIQDHLKDQFKLFASLNTNNVEECIGILKKTINSNNQNHTDITKRFIENKIKIDFMNILFKCLPTSIDNNKSAPFVKFLSLFNNYFTLNYDPILYYLLTKFKQKDTRIYTSNNLEQTIKTKIKNILTDNNLSSCNPYNENEPKTNELLKNQKNDIIKTTIINLFKNDNDDTFKQQIFTKNNNLKDGIGKIIKEAISIFKEGPVNKNLCLLNSNDGFNKIENVLTWIHTEEQNVFYLHGAFHIMQDNNIIFKIKSDDINTMIKNIELHLEDEKIPVSILSDTTAEKQAQIEKIPYLKHCLEKLEKVENILVTFGIKFADNDQHIIDAIEKNNRNSKKPAPS